MSDIKTAIKIYKVRFREYTNSSQNVVSTGESANDPYLYVNKDDGCLLIREDEFEFYRKYGKGFEKAEFVGIKLELS